MVDCKIKLDRKKLHKHSLSSKVPIQSLFGGCLWNRVSLPQISHNEKANIWVLKKESLFKLGWSLRKIACETVLLYNGKIERYCVEDGQIAKIATEHSLLWRVKKFSVTSRKIFIKLSAQKIFIIIFYLLNWADKNSDSPFFELECTI